MALKPFFGLGFVSIALTLGVMASSKPVYSQSGTRPRPGVPAGPMPGIPTNPIRPSACCVGQNSGGFVMSTTPLPNGCHHGCPYLWPARGYGSHPSLG